jgi:hypothetical protein
MQKKGTNILLAITFGASILLACQKSASEQLDVLALKHQELVCKLARLEDSVQYHWISLNALLERHLPPDIPREERRNILTVKNVPLIRMFESYDKLEGKVKDAVNSIEEYDSQSACEVTRIRDMIKKLEFQRMEIIAMIDKGDTELIKRARQRYEDIIRGPCQ